MTTSPLLQVLQSIGSCSSPDAALVQLLQGLRDEYQGPFADAGLMASIDAAHARALVAANHREPSQTNLRTSQKPYGDYFEPFEPPHRFAAEKDSPWPWLSETLEQVGTVPALDAAIALLEVLEADGEPDQQIEANSARIRLRWAFRQGLG